MKEDETVDMPLTKVVPQPGKESRMAKLNKKEEGILATLYKFKKFYEMDKLLEMNIRPRDILKSLAHATPESYTIVFRLSSSAGGLALPGNAKPMASEIDAIVFAVNIPPQEPELGHAVFSIFFSISKEICPASYAPTAS